MPSFTKLAAVALYAASASAVALDNSFDFLAKRQSGLTEDSIPQICRSDCSSIINALNDCTTTPSVGCICSSRNGNNLKTCVDCIISIAPTAALRTQGQGILDNFNSQCPAVTPVSISGSSPTSATGTAGFTGRSSTATPTFTDDDLFGSSTASGSRTSTTPRPAPSGEFADDSTGDDSGGDDSGSSGSNPFDNITGGNNNGALVNAGGLFVAGLCTILGAALVL